MNDFAVSLADIRLRRELVAEGWSDRDIARQVRLGHLSKVRYGAYVASSQLSGLNDEGLLRVRSRAVLLRAHPSSVLSHHTALAEYEVPLWGVDLSETHLTRTDGRAGRRETGVAHHRGRLAHDHWKVHVGVPVVVPQRATIEVVLAHSPEVGLVAACGALSTGVITHAELVTAAEAADRWPDSLNARLVVARADRRLTSVGEARTWHLFHEHRIPLPEPQVEVRDERGALLGIVDFLWRGHGVFLEFDGKLKYERFRRPGESLDAYLMREKRREELICQVTGWVCIRITWADLENPIRLVGRIVSLLSGHANPAA